MPSVTDAIVLCGGAGTRLRSVTGDAPKSLATIGDRPFLDILINQLRRYGFERVILAVGYQRDLIQAYFESRIYNVSLVYSVESTPLGTGGALRNAADHIKSDAALIMNGDSYTDVDLRRFLAEHKKSGADLSVVVVPNDGRVDCGLVSADAGGRVLGFKEKLSATGIQYVNAGMYMADKKILYEVPSNQRFSLEEELFPRLLAARKNIRTFHHSGTCVDIGTPERYLQAQATLAQVEPERFASNKGPRA